MSRDGGLVDAGGTKGTGDAPAAGGVAASGGTSGSNSRGGLGIAGDLPGRSCGNGQHEDGEECDDSNTAGGDGCSAACEIEADTSCPIVGPCTSIVVCGNGVVSVTREDCDDGNAVSGDGCSSTCQLEPGWTCPGTGVPCRPRCGDSALIAPEPCDDGNTANGDGCSSACRIESPRCPPPPDGTAGMGGAGGAADEGAMPACVDPLCGDGKVDAPEECDDGTAKNDGHYAGCTADCHYAAFCGDGIVTPDLEECDGWRDVPTATEPRCTACRLVPYCGDGIIQADLGEQCDRGPKNGSSSCRANCTIDLR
jgi:cysteine-rich repeat protein